MRDASFAMAAPAMPSAPDRVTLPSRSGGNARKVVVVHSGARDRYQLAVGLSRAGLLEYLVTDFFWSEDTRLRAWLARHLPARVVAILRQRSAPGLPSAQVKTCVTAGVAGFLLDKARAIPYPVRRWFTRRSDTTLGSMAGRIARRTGAELVSYSYYAHAAFQAAGRAGMLFQMHPHPQTMRDLLQEEIEAHPDCAASLQQEWELNLPPEDFQRLVEETLMPARSLAASSFTRSSLVAHGTPPESVQVVPYGIDLNAFHPGGSTRSTEGPLKLLFVGRINQRKGIKYLLQALAMLPESAVELTVCGRVMDSLDLFQQAGTRVRVRPSVSSAELVEAYQQADLFLLPSIAEGFGQVLLEALACGLPILATTHTAAPDLIQDGVEGFLVEPRRPDQIAERIQWAVHHRAELLQMRVAARNRAEQFPWSRFHEQVSRAVVEFLDTASRQKEAASCS